jgi:hypothetical protein
VAQAALNVDDIEAKGLHERLLVADDYVASKLHC